jgi:hypothetical protein
LGFRVSFANSLAVLSLLDSAANKSSPALKASCTLGMRARKIGRGMITKRFPVPPQ